MSISRMANMLSTIENTVRIKKAYTEVFYSKTCEAVAKLLKEKGFASEVKVYKPEGKAYKMLRIGFVYDGASPVLEKIKLISKPGRKIYKGAGELRQVAGGYGMQIVSTSRGIMTSGEAKKKKLGGEVICEVR